MKRPNRKSITIIEAANGLAVSLSTFKQYARVDDDTSDDALITMFINAATDMAQRYCKRYFLETTIKLTMDGFANSDLVHDGFYECSGMVSMPSPTYGIGNAVDLPFPPIKSITSITTYATDNSSSVFSSTAYTLDKEGGRVFLNNGYSWPSSLRDQNAVEITFVAGYGSDNEDVPYAIQTAIMQHAAQMYECRSMCDLPDASKAMLNAYKIYDQLAWL